MPDMSEAEYRAGLTAMEQRHAQAIEKAQKAIEAGARGSARNQILSVSREAGVASEALDDIATMIMAKITISPEGELLDSSGNPVDVSEMTRKFLAERPYYRYIQPSPIGPKPGEKWDIQRAKNDAEYMKAWKSADPEGFGKEWNEMLRKLAPSGSPRNKNWASPNPDVERAKHDEAFVREWKSRDPEGYAREMKREIGRLNELLSKGQLRD